MINWRGKPHMEETQSKTALGKNMVTALGRKALVQCCSQVSIPHKEHQGLKPWK